MAKHIEAQLVRPVQVLEDHQHRDARCHGHEHVDQVLHQQSASVVRITGRRGNRAHPRRQAPPEIAQRRLACGRQVAGQVQQQTPERLHVTRERRRTDHREVIDLSMPRDRAEQACLANARFARDEQQLARAFCGIGEPAFGKGEEAVPADENR